MFIGLADSEQHDVFNIVHNKEMLTMGLKTLELKTIEYQIEEEDDKNFYDDNNSDQFKIESAHFKQVNQNETLSMNVKLKNFGVTTNPLQTG